MPTASASLTEAGTRASRRQGLRSVAVLLVRVESALRGHLALGGLLDPSDLLGCRTLVRVGAPGATLPALNPFTDQAPPSAPPQALCPEKPPEADTLNLDAPSGPNTTAAPPDKFH